MKGLSTLVTVILLVMISVALVGTAYLWITGVFQRASEQVSGETQRRTSELTAELKIDSILDNKIFVRNRGGSDLTSMITYANGSKLQNVTLDLDGTPASILPQGRSGTFTIFPETKLFGDYSLRITTGEGAETVQSATFKYWPLDGDYWTENSSTRWSESGRFPTGGFGTFCFQCIFLLDQKDSKVGSFSINYTNIQYPMVYLFYPKPKDARWDLTKYTKIMFWFKTNSKDTTNYQVWLATGQNQVSPVNSYVYTLFPGFSPIPGGWRRFEIPLSNFTRMGNGDLGNINFFLLNHTQIQSSPYYHETLIDGLHFE